MTKILTCYNWKSNTKENHTNGTVKLSPCRVGSRCSSYEHLFVTIGNGLTPLTVVTMNSVLDVSEVLDALFACLFLIFQKTFLAAPNDYHSLLESNFQLKPFCIETS